MIIIHQRCSDLGIEKGTGFFTESKFQDFKILGAGMKNLGYRIAG
jgi:hypothetical protein